MVPPAPGRFSTTKGWPIACARRLDIKRPIVSEAAPVANGTITLTGLSG